jgi:hypothetical protein
MTGPRGDKKCEVWKRSWARMLFLSSEYRTKDALERFGDFRIGGKVICTVKYADDLVLLTEAELVVQGIIDRLIELEDAVEWQ